ncbi:hypothetical protein [Williamwhitmania taraxaci]|uniref:LPP20 lipoprotein n=1 Tax=Williamwhitmania taraxaci TaxID=1640674 RepID=A0A1G6SC61_9BACT|nr:hypothetical protein [Williamwhitmania taraxaci]SDD13727.1 hypothetical protein SAMN05216323_109011 [Williamwhitmania taraxaci]
MKNSLVRNLGLAFIAVSLVSFSSCKSHKDVIKPTDEMKEVVTPCGDEEFHSDAKFFRGSGIGNSQDQATAKSKANLDAARNLAASINRTLKSVTDRYTNERQIGENSEFEQKFEDMTRDVVNQEMNNVSTVCAKTYQDPKDKKYKVYMALEVAKDELLNNIKDKISKDQKLQLDYDKQKFENIFNEEMEKLSNERK